MRVDDLLLEDDGFLQQTVRIVEGMDSLSGVGLYAFIQMAVDDRRKF